MSEKYPAIAEEPMKRFATFHTGDDGYVILAWTFRRPFHILVYSGFRTVTDARAFGRTYFKRRYQVSGAWKHTTAIKYHLS
jgi:hypothetical protein